jgi:hypothetical protein
VAKELLSVSSFVVSLMLPPTPYPLPPHPQEVLYIKLIYKIFLGLISAFYTSMYFVLPLRGNPHASGRKAEAARF